MHLQKEQQIETTKKIQLKIDSKKRFGSCKPIFGASKYDQLSLSRIPKVQYAISHFGKKVSGKQKQRKKWQ